MFIVNASNRYTIAMTDIEPRNWNYYTMYISRVIHGVMQEMGYSEDQIQLEQCINKANWFCKNGTRII